MTSDTDPTPFLHAIRDKPNCDTTRLVYADWLEEHNEEHNEEKFAKFIRVQIQNAKQPEFLVARVRAMSKVGYDPIHFTDILGARPWERIGLRRDLIANRSALLFLMGYGPWSNVNHGIGWHRGFPAVVCCTERNWHVNFEKFTVPPQLVCLRRSAGIWRTYPCNERNGWVCRSLANTAVAS